MADTKHPLSLLNDSCQSDGALGCILPPDAKLLAAGWERRFIADPRMTRDAVDTYSDLGYEVKLQPLNTDRVLDQCSGCKAMLESFNEVYTRKRSVKPDDE